MALGGFGVIDDDDVATVVRGVVPRFCCFQPDVPVDIVGGCIEGGRGLSLFPSFRLRGGFGRSLVLARDDFNGSFNKSTIEKQSPMLEEREETHLI
jgi:hypothetical protein